MKIHRIVFFFFILLLIAYHQNASGWGFWAHRKINNQAVNTLPKEMKGFYNYYQDYITDHSIDPDKKRFCAMDEAPHHFIDLDHYCAIPCDAMPRHWKDAVSKYTEDTLNKYGTVPWYICLEYYNLVKAFKEKNPEHILKISSDIGHYISDSYVPLHATMNYDGQLTRQLGIHAFWESNVPELEGNSYDYNVGSAKYIENINDFAWLGSLSAATEVDSVLGADKEMKTFFPYDKMYCIDFNRQNKPYLKLSEDFTRAYSAMLHGMVERRMRSSIYAIGCIWMSAWIEAGQPELDSMVGKAVLETGDDESK